MHGASIVHGSRAAKIWRKRLPPKMQQRETVSREWTIKQLATGRDVNRGMAGPIEASFATMLGIASHAGDILSATFLRFGSTFSIFSLGSALAISTAFILLRRARKSRKPHSLKVLIRALFPRWFRRGASTRADFGFFLLNCFAMAGLIGWALLSSGAVSQTTLRVLNGAFGAPRRLPVAPFWRETLLTLALFLAYDFAIWIDHYLKHKIPVLWEFHRVHHMVEVLSPLTNFRKHPVDNLIFFNIAALIVGAIHGVGVYMLGDGAQMMNLSGTNIILVVFIFITIHLQHSHIDIRFGGWLGRLIVSPAHHQIHHSSLPEHYDSNLGSCLAVWDWMFGTLILPDMLKGRLKFGADAEGDRYTPHSAAGALLWPFVRAFRILIPRTQPLKSASGLISSNK
jgi:sterol desaturase/sphingolipid hydroxylase (fatty acid hydroxylase superfamily)